MVWLNNARIISIFSVVLLHVTAVVLSNNDIGTEYWWLGNLFNSFVRWCVPVFVMLSGALLLDDRKKESLSKFYKKRLSKILIPILFWSLFFSCLTFLHSYMDGIKLSIQDLLINLLTGAPYEHMWFLYMILGLYVFVPFFRKITTASKLNEIKFLTIAIFSIVSINVIYQSIYDYGRSDLFINWFLLYIPFFFMGYLIRKDNWQPPKIVLWIIFLVSSAVAAAGNYFILTENTSLSESYFHGYLSMTVIPMSISIMYLLKDWERPILNKDFTSEMSLLTLGVYLIHPIIIEVLNKTNYSTNMHPIISIPMITVTVFASSMAISWTLFKVPYLNRVI